MKEGVLKNLAIFTGKHLCWSLIKFIKLHVKETSTQVFFCEYCKIFKNIYFEDIWERLLLNLFSRLRKSLWTFVDPSLALVLSTLTSQIHLHDFKIIFLFLWIHFCSFYLLPPFFHRFFETSSSFSSI